MRGLVLLGVRPILAREALGGVMKKWLKAVKDAVVWIAESAKEAIFKPRSK